MNFKGCLILLNLCHIRYIEVPAGKKKIKLAFGIVSVLKRQPVWRIYACAALAEITHTLQGLHRGLRCVSAWRLWPGDLTLREEHSAGVQMFYLGHCGISMWDRTNDCERILNSSEHPFPRSDSLERRGLNGWTLDVRLVWESGVNHFLMSTSKRIVKLQMQRYPMVY